MNRTTHDPVGEEEKTRWGDAHFLLRADGCSAWADKKECRIARRDMAFVMCGEERLFAVDLEYTDAQIWDFLKVANIAFARGRSEGWDDKEREIQNAVYKLKTVLRF